MAFKKMTEYNEAKFGNFFRLVNDKDYADVIILYQSTRDVLIADTHYIKSPDYSGYVQCIEKGCPACEKGIRIQSKLFIPMLVLSHSDPDFKGPKIQFWDRSMRFQPQLMNDVFRNYPNPSEMIFRITRHGVAGSVDTYYTIQVVQHVPESFGSFEQILATNKIVLPNDYDMVCKDYNRFELGAMLDAPRDGSSVAGVNYGATPRGTYNSASQTADIDSAVVTAPQSYEYVSPGFAADGEVAIPAPAPGAESIEIDEIEDEVNF